MPINCHVPAGVVLDKTIPLRTISSVANSVSVSGLEVFILILIKALEALLTPPPMSSPITSLTSYNR